MIIWWKRSNLKLILCSCQTKLSISKKQKTLSLFSARKTFTFLCMRNFHFHLQEKHSFFSAGKTFTFICRRKFPLQEKLSPFSAGETFTAICRRNFHFSLQEKVLELQETNTRLTGQLKENRLICQKSLLIMVIIIIISYDSFSFGMCHFSLFPSSE